MKNFFVEITVSDGISEFMVHLDPEGNPIRLYTYVDKLGSWPKDKDWDESDAEWAAREVYDRKNYKKENRLNSLYVYAKSKKWVINIWKNHLSRFVNEEDMEFLNK